MPRYQRDIGDVAESVLAELAPAQTKVAAAVQTSPAGQAMTKIAELLRDESKSEISYEDLQKFRVTHGV